MDISKALLKGACVLLVLAGGLIVTSFSLRSKPAAGTYIINVGTPAKLKDFFHYTKDRIPFISSHRGGPKKRPA